MLFSPSKGQLKPAKFLTTKNFFAFVVASHGREIGISNLNHKEKTKRNTRRGFSCLRVAQVTCATGGSDDVTRLAPIDWY